MTNTGVSWWAQSRVVPFRSRHRALVRVQVCVIPAGGREELVELWRRWEEELKGASGSLARDDALR